MRYPFALRQAFRTFERNRLEKPMKLYIQFPVAERYSDYIVGSKSYNQLRFGGRKLKERFKIRHKVWRGGRECAFRLMTPNYFCPKRAERLREIRREYRKQKELDNGN